MPTVLVDGAFIVAESVNARGSAEVTLATTFSNGTLLYTLDGSEPSFASRFYAGPFTVRKASVLRAIAASLSRGRGGGKPMVRRAILSMT
jgi:hypothetical protein